MENFGLYSIGGFVVGLLVGITGVGGGSLMTPLLVNIFGVAPLKAVGTDLAFAAVTKAFGTIFHKNEGNVRWDIVKRLMLGSIPAAILSIIWLKAQGELSHEQQDHIKKIIGICVLLTVFAMFFRGKVVQWMLDNPQYELRGKAQWLVTVILGAVIGVLVTTSSIGAGAVGATAILMIYPHLKPAEVAGTDIAYAVPLTLVASIGHFWLGNINWVLLGALLVGSIPGIYVGSKLASRLPEQVVRAILGLIMIYVAVKMLT